MTEIIPFNQFSDQEVLYCAASLESGSEHPLAKAILEKAKALDLNLAAVTDFNNNPGYGIEGIVEDQKILVGNLNWMQQKQINSDMANIMIQKLQDEAKTVVCVVKDHEMIGVIAIADTVKNYAHEVN